MNFKKIADTRFKLSFMNIRHLHLNFVDCQSFLESNSPDILALCETNLDGSIDLAKNFLVLICMVSQFMWRKDFLLHGSYLQKTADSYLFLTGFTLSVLLHFPLSTPSSSSWTVFYSISFNIDEILLINPSANVLVFGDFNVHHKDWLTVELIDPVNSVG